MSLKRAIGKRRRKADSITESFLTTRKVEYADAATQTEADYTDDDYYSCFLIPAQDPVADLYEREEHVNHPVTKPEVKIEPTIQHIHYTVSCSEQPDPPAYEKNAGDSQRRVSCSICKKSFSSMSCYAQHKTVHTGERPHKCEFCHKTFRQQGNLASHRRTHIGLKPYKCDICDKRFANSSNVAVHKRTHTGEKPFECELCHKRFSQFAHLVGHKRTHTGEAPFQCDICEKRFNNPSNLTTHKRIHIGDRPYQCDICHKTFKQSGHLTSHKKSHSGTKELSRVKIGKRVTPGYSKALPVIVKQEKQ